MSEENIALTRQGFEAWSRGDRDWVVTHTHPESEWIPAGIFPGSKPVYRGKEGIEEFWDFFLEAWETLELDTDRILEVDEESCLALCTMRGRGRSSGVDVKVRYAYLVTFSNGLVIRARGFSDWDEALEAAGLSE
jgi:ketosteroid isomerase-like protein